MHIPRGKEHLLLPMPVQDAILLSVRLAAKVDGAPKRCRRPACRNGRCHLTLDKEGTGHCPGGISEQAREYAAAMLVFLERLLNGDKN
jgi:hypothetical protein